MCIYTPPLSTYQGNGQRPPRVNTEWVIFPQLVPNIYGKTAAASDCNMHPPEGANRNLSKSQFNVPGAILDNLAKAAVKLPGLVQRNTTVFLS